MTIWLTSDQHYGHANIIKYENRPFIDVGHMEEALVRFHNERVQPLDMVWHLGDFCFGGMAEVRRILARLNGHHHLVAGNHDRCHPIHRQHVKNARGYLAAGFLSVCRTCTLPVRTGALLSHLPYAGDSRHDDRYPEWRPKDEGAWLFHGHVHSAWKTRGRMINVGVDVWDYAPVSLDALLELRENLS